MAGGGQGLRRVFLGAWPLTQGIEIDTEIAENFIQRKVIEQSDSLLRVTAGHMSEGAEGSDHCAQLPFKRRRSLVSRGIIWVVLYVDCWFSSYITLYLTYLSLPIIHLILIIYTASML